jgi:hypothetical protein
MIDLKNRLVFIHIPKTGGSSVERYIDPIRLQQDHRPLRVLLNNLSFPITIEKLRYSSLRLAYTLHPLIKPYNKLVISPSDLHSFTFFTVVRDPWSRAYSWYRNVIRDKIHQTKYQVSATTTFECFLENQLGNSALRSQLYWLESFGSIIPSYLKIFKFDSFATDVPLFLKEKLPLNPMPHALFSMTSPPLITKYSFNLIKDYYEKEIAMFNFTCPFDTKS